MDYIKTKKQKKIEEGTIVLMKPFFIPCAYKKNLKNNITRVKLPIYKVN